jgi:hypothetical protein
MGANTNNFAVAVSKASADVEALVQTIGKWAMAIDANKKQFVAYHDQKLNVNIGDLMSKWLECDSGLKADVKASVGKYKAFETAISTFETHLNARKKTITSKLRPKAFTSIPKAEALIKTAKGIQGEWYNLIASS